jgi:hypothetical protein
MNSSNAENTPRGEVILRGFDVNNELVTEEHISVFDYYDDLHAILDEDVSYRVERGIRRVEGHIYNENGELDQEFNNEYDNAGRYVGSRIVFADGTVSERSA